MTFKIQPSTIFKILFRPMSVLKEVANNDVSASSLFFKIAIWLGLLPPTFAWLGASHFGWRIGAVEPLYLPANILLMISVSYYLALIFGFASTAFISRWMAVTYGATDSLGIHFVLITVIGAPLIVGSVIHLYPDAFINVLVLVPVLIWSMSLLYRGLPLALNISAESGMLMASALIAYLLVAFVSLLGITTILWSHGIGPSLGI